ncbi:iron chelate uptake ABC transporter family permease subunit [Streptosporangium sp. NBC_01755]|uniref:iron chelate uptake ABC transporter family permease subunit n=1 Tax=unclassified Streptosporangium TaxID=2632669 RepID=UPI002DD8563F|nr:MULTISPECIES: iron chelate uptake ABC transporter family permease subunit [unclassified Streptosporangium]WSA26580.1 iron chelate uptake ABC transporter family permease subunit [Streptosporangium sp. NBC_01810]WSD01996.1 iron chelate uptake ABC transporter family permease subunit [Streptosporangium sp. NBC_01755]
MRRRRPGARSCRGPTATGRDRTRNPLAGPDILGVTTGASVTVVAVIVAAGNTWGGVSGVLAEAGVPAAALLGGLLGALTVYLLAWRSGMDGYRLVLVGTASLGALRFGDDTVTGLGVRMNLARGLMILAAVLLAATATASAGPIAFVALTAPQIALRLAGVAQPPLVVSALTGAVLVVGADLVARGRHPHQTWYRQWSSDDESAVGVALAMTGLLDLGDRPLDELSGGQRQRAWISMTSGSNRARPVRPLIEERVHEDLGIEPGHTDRPLPETDRLNRAGLTPRGARPRRPRDRKGRGRRDPRQGRPA